MSSEVRDLEVPAKRKRGPRACLECQRKKRRCDGAAGTQCSNCIESHHECIYPNPRKRGPKTGYPEGYVEELQWRISQLELQVEQMGQMLKNLVPDIDLETLTSSYPPRSIDSSLGGYSSDSTSEADEEDDLVHIQVSEHLEKLMTERRFFGSSSSFSFLRDAMNVKKDCTGIDPEKIYDKRLQNWIMRPWQLRCANQWTPVYTFPPTDLLMSLVDIYFSRIHPQYPFLHGPTFKASLAGMLHLQNNQFGATVLLVCAVASGLSDDSRVVVDGDKTSAGWKFYEQVPTLRKDLFYPPSVYEMQFCCLAALYVHTTAAPLAPWTLANIGLMLSVDIGAHRRKPEGYKLTVEDELKKRAFWCLVCTERTCRSFLGRPAFLNDEDYDVELPTECDDEYWIISSSGHVTFRQPPNEPSYITFFIKRLELSNMLSLGLRYLYATKKSKVWMGNAGEEWEGRVLQQLSAGLETWSMSVPKHLKWPPSPDNQNMTFLTQAAFLQAAYYETTLQIHRPFIHKRTSLSVNALATCTNASRECIKILELHVARGGLLMPHTILVTFMVGTTLLLNIWTAQLHGVVPVHEAREWEDVKTCMRLLKAHEERWQLAGALWDCLHELALIPDSPIQALASAASFHCQPGPLTGNPVQEPSTLFPATSAPAEKEAHLHSIPTPTPPAHLQLDPTVNPSLLDQFFPPHHPDPVCADNAAVNGLFTGSGSGSVYTDTWSTPVGFNLENSSWGTFITSEGGFVDEQR